MAILSLEQKEQFWAQGFLVAPSGASAEQTTALGAQVDRWVEESRQQHSNYGETADGKARFDLEPGHSALSPRLRRVSNPCDISQAFLDVMRNAALVDMVSDLIGPDVKYHHAKLNIKLPGMDTHVGYHQDHPFDPHTNDDVIVCLLMLDDVSEENGCTYVLPGSHRGEHFSHYRDGRFVGEILPAQIPDIDTRAAPATGKVGDVILMHTWAIHGGPANKSDKPRRLLITDYTAADAYPLTPPKVGSSYCGEVVRGKPSPTARLISDIIELPPNYSDDSFFSVQGQESAAG
ncbi:MAG: phytanoyl-CoA dioxygenase family protein [Alphaproteobacteria bacterium]|jgi:phytanoyl-CoA hydroxylase